MKRAVFLDRDGVINQKARKGEYILSWEEIKFLPGAMEAVSLLNQAGITVIVVTNQRCVATGLITIAGLNSIHARMCDAMARSGAIIDAVYYCPHELQPICSCRKPMPGMLLQAARAYNIDLAASWMIGDSAIDIQAGRNAGCTTVELLEPNEIAAGNADMTAISLLEASRKILQQLEVEKGSEK